MRSHETSPLETGDRSRHVAPAPPPSLPAADELARQVAATVCSPRADFLARALSASAADAACYEASVRGGAGTPPAAGRMMIERASRDVLDAVASALEVKLPANASAWLALAERERLPLIVGWDLRGGGERRCVKLYVNASDASESTRSRLRDELAPGIGPGGDVLAVLGMNVCADGAVESKLYIQSADVVELAAGWGVRANQLARAARDEGADAGGVLSFDVVGSDLQARAFFVALREPRRERAWECILSLPGYDSAIVEALLPFTPAPPRSLGISLAASAAPPVWTLYFKPRASGRAPEALEPAAIFRDGGVEVGVFVEPTEHAARAFRRTERHAVSVRLRDGEPEAGSLEPLVDWFTARLRDSENDGGSLAAHLADPPPPWHVVGIAGRRS